MDEERNHKWERATIRQSKGPHTIFIPLQSKEKSATNRQGEFLKLGNGKGEDTVRQLNFRKSHIYDDHSYSCLTVAPREEPRRKQAIVRQENVPQLDRGEPHQDAPKLYGCPKPSE